MPGYLMLANARGGQLQSFRCIRKHPFQTPHSWAADAWREAARESALAGSQLEQLTLAWPGQVPPEGMESGLEQTEKFRWIDARNFLPAWHDSAEGAAEWMVRLALGGAA
jgi:hypothetical protein